MSWRIIKSSLSHPIFLIIWTYCGFMLEIPNSIEYNFGISHGGARKCICPMDLCDAGSLLCCASSLADPKGAQKPGSEPDSTFLRFLSAIPAKVWAQMYYNTTAASAPSPELHELLTHVVACGLCSSFSKQTCTDAGSKAGLELLEGKKLARTGKAMNL